MASLKIHAERDTAASIASLGRFRSRSRECLGRPERSLLPGLAEHLGLVRSAIHNPLKELESSGLISTRSAHVVGGGPRRRTVVHLTDTGRQRAELLSEEEMPDKSESLAVGPIPNHIQIQGRDDELESLLTKILAGENLQLTGLPESEKLAFHAPLQSY